MTGRSGSLVPAALPSSFSPFFLSTLCSGGGGDDGSPPTDKRLSALQQTMLTKVHQLMDCWWWWWLGNSNPKELMFGMRDKNECLLLYI